jgi:hypothetical protein
MLNCFKELGIHATILNAVDGLWVHTHFIKVSAVAVYHMQLANMKFIVLRLPNHPVLFWVGCLIWHTRPPK